MQLSSFYPPSASLNPQQHPCRVGGAWPSYSQSIASAYPEPKGFDASIAWDCWLGAMVRVCDLIGLLVLISSTGFYLLREADGGNSDGQHLLST